MKIFKNFIQKLFQQQKQEYNLNKFQVLRENELFLYIKQRKIYQNKIKSCFIKDQTISTNNKQINKQIIEKQNEGKIVRVNKISQSKFQQQLRKVVQSTIQNCSHCFSKRKIKQVMSE
ncbi:hypothetical protein ABPG74_008297 [Tetrahymena malaccensis]